MIGRLIVQAGFLTVASQLLMLLAALPGAFLLPPSLPLQLAMTLPILVGLLFFVLPKVAQRFFGAKGELPLLRTWFGAAVFAALAAVGAAFAAGVSQGIVTVTEAQILALLLLFFLNLSIAHQWLGAESD